MIDTVIRLVIYLAQLQMKRCKIVTRNLKASSAALRGNLSELSLFLILVLFLSYVTSEKSYDGTAKDISSILVVSKADVRSYPSRNSGIPRRCKGVSMPLYQTAMRVIYLVKLSMYAGYLLLLAMLA